MRIFYLFSVIFLLSISSISGQVQLIPQDSVGLMDFLLLQEQVPGMNYRFVVVEDQKDLLSLSEMGFVETDSGFYSKLRPLG